jgi:hypothetical protein
MSIAGATGLCSLLLTKVSIAKELSASTDAKESTDTDMCISLVRSNLLRPY